MERMSRGATISQLSILATCALLCACEQPPPLAFQHAKPVENAFSSDGRGGYDWPVTGSGGFDVLRPSPFTYFDQIDREKLAVAAELPLFQEADAGTRPDGMEEDVYYWFRRYTEPHEPTTASFSIHVDDDVWATGFDLDAAGDRLITIGEKVQIWDVAKEQLLHSYPCSSEPLRAFLGDDSDRFTVVTKQSLELFSVPTGTKLAQWSSPDEIESAFVARDRSVYCVTTKQHRLFALDGELKMLAEYQEHPLSNAHAAVHPTGKWIIANTKAGPLRWHLEDGSYQAEVLSAYKYSAGVARCVSGVHYDRWIGPDYATLYYGEQWLHPTEYSGVDYMLTGHVLWAQDCTVDDTQGWTLAMGHQPGIEGPPRYVLQDVELASQSASVPLVLEEEPIDLATSQAGERIVLSNVDAVNVIHRRRWVDLFGSWTTERMLTLLAEGRVDQLERCIELLREQPRVRLNVTGEEYCSYAILRLGVRWAQLESEGDAPETLKKLEDWYASGSDLALAVSAQRHYRTAWDGRGGGYANTVTQQGWQIFQKHAELGKQDLKRLLERERPPAFAFEAMVVAMRDTGMDHLEAEPYLQRYVTLYPHSIRAHVNLCFWMLPKWGGSPGDGGAYVGALANLYPEFMSDLVYAKCALLCHRISSPDDYYEAGFSERRLISGVERMMEMDYLTPADMQVILPIASGRNAELSQRLTDHYVRRFGMVNSVGYYYDAGENSNPLLAAKAQAFAAAE